MKKGAAEAVYRLGGIITAIYLVLMFAILPLYIQDGYSNIANAKYDMYRLLTIPYVVFCGGICLPAEIIFGRKKIHFGKHTLPALFILIHLLMQIVTWFFAIDRKTAFEGNGSWHMGLLSQILMLLTALLICNYYSDSVYIRGAAMTGAALTGLLTVLNRFDIYPIDMGTTYPGFISTLGQTNWATMYMACLMGAGLGLYVYEEKMPHRILILLLDAVIIAGAWVVGSDTVLVVMLLEFFVLLGICLKKRDYLVRFSELLAVFGGVSEIIYLLVFVLFHDSFVFVDEGDAVNTVLKMHIGIVILIAAMALHMILKTTRDRGWNEELFARCFHMLALIIVVMLAVVILLMALVTCAPDRAGVLTKIRLLRFDDDWGTHRGLNWRCAVAGFARLSPFRKVVGTGQGGFQALMASFPDLQARIEQMYGSFALKVAHNEYLNMLIENGIVGCVSYIGIFVSSFVFLGKRAGDSRCSLSALLALTGYTACSIFFFQHVYATSFMYIFIGMAVAEYYRLSTVR